MTLQSRIGTASLNSALANSKCHRIPQFIVYMLLQLVPEHASCEDNSCKTEFVNQGSNPYSKSNLPQGLTAPQKAQGRAHLQTSEFTRP